MPSATPAEMAETPGTTLMLLDWPKTAPGTAPPLSRAAGVKPAGGCSSTGEGFFIAAEMREGADSCAFIMSGATGAGEGDAGWEPGFWNAAGLGLGMAGAEAAGVLATGTSSDSDATTVCAVWLEAGTAWCTGRRNTTMSTLPMAAGTAAIMSHFFQSGFGASASSKVSAARNIGVSGALPNAAGEGLAAAFCGPPNRRPVLAGGAGGRGFAFASTALASDGWVARIHALSQAVKSV